MVLAAAAAHRVFIQDTQARYGFPGIQNPRLCASNRIDKPARERGNSAEPLQEIQDHPLARKNHASVVPDYGYCLPAMQSYAIEYLGMTGDFIMRNHSRVQHGVYIQDARYASHPRQDAILLGNNRPGRALTGLNAGGTGRVASGTIFEQCVLKDGSDAATVPVHICGAAIFVLLTTDH